MQVPRDKILRIPILSLDSAIGQAELMVAPDQLHLSTRPAPVMTASEYTSRLGPTTRPHIMHVCMYAFSALCASDTCPIIGNVFKYQRLRYPRSALFEPCLAIATWLNSSSKVSCGVTNSSWPGIKCTFNDESTLL